MTTKVVEKLQMYDNKGGRDITDMMTMVQDMTDIRQKGDRHITDMTTMVQDMTDI
jgi:hypothetical protein